MNILILIHTICIPREHFLSGQQHGEALVSYLGAQGIPASVIGRVTDGNDRVIRNGSEQRYLDRPKPDEWYRIEMGAKGQ